MNFLNNYFTENGAKLYLPLWTKSKDEIKGGYSTFTLKEFTDLHQNIPVKCKGKKGTEYDYKFYKTYDNADLYELNLRSSKYNIVSFDVDDALDTFGKVKLAEYNEDEKKQWINDNVPKIIRQLPFSLSRGKRLPHYYCILEGVDNLKSISSNILDCLTFCKGDILVVNSWEKKDFEVKNYNGVLPTLHINDIKEFITTKGLEVLMNKNNKQKPKPIQYNSDSDHRIFLTDDDFSDDEFEDDVKIQPNNKIVSNDKSEDDVKIQPTKKFVSNDDENVKLQRLHKVLECYSIEWFQNYSNWLNFTIAFINCFDGKNYKVYNDICKKFDKYDPKTQKYQCYDEEKNMNTWNDLKLKTKSRDKKLGFGSFIKWAKDQDESKYYQLFPKTNSKINIDWNRLTESEFSKNLYNMFFKSKTGQSLLLFTGKEKTPNGYFYNGVYWTSLGQNYCSIKKGYFNKLYKLYINELNNLRTNEEMDDKSYKSLMKKIQELDKLTIRNNVVKIIIDENHINEDKIKWNANNNLFAFENKIYDLSLGQFIEPKPEQYINITCGYEYIEGEFETEKKDINKFFDSIISKESSNDEKPYLLKVLSSFLRQQNKEEQAYFFTGKGRNGKGTVSSLTNNALGNYWGELNIEYYTAYNKQNNSHNQTLYNCRNARVINTSEISDTNENGSAVKFISSNFKSISGGDTMTARKCGSEETATFKAGKVLIQTNVLPEFSKMDISLKERIIVFNFPYTFTDDSKLIKSNPNMYKAKDKSLKDKFNTETYKIAFIQMLFEYYKEYLKTGLATPKTVKDNCTNYFDSSNGIKKWFFENFKYQYEGMTQEQIKNQPKQKYLLKDLIEMYKNDDGVNDKISVKIFKTKLEEIDGIENYIKKSKEGHFELQQWIKINNNAELEEDIIDPLDY